MTLNNKIFHAIVGCIIILFTVSQYWMFQQAENIDRVSIHSNLIKYISDNTSSIVLESVNYSEEKEKEQENFSTPSHNADLDDSADFEPTLYKRGNLSPLSSFSSGKKILNNIILMNSTNTDKILCWVTTSKQNEKTQLNAIRKTWGSLCDTIVFFSDHEDLSIPIIKSKGLEEDKRYPWVSFDFQIKYIHQKYGQDYDWFLKVTDQTYVFMENLRYYLKSQKLQQSLQEGKPMFLGHVLSLNPKEFKKHYEISKINRGCAHCPYINSKTFKSLESSYTKMFPYKMFHYIRQESGYIMNRDFVDKLYTLTRSGKCFRQIYIPEELAISICMHHFYKIKPFPTRDEFGRERFHNYHPDNLLLEDKEGDEGWKKLHIGIDFHPGADCCSRRSIMFPQLNDTEIIHIHQAFH